MQQLQTWYVIIQLTFWFGTIAAQTSSFSSWLDLCANGEHVNCLNLSPTVNSNFNYAPLQLAAVRVTTANCTISNCPPISISSGSIVRFENVNFLNATVSDGDGAAVHINNSTVTFISCTFTDVCSTNGNGGAVYMKSSKVNLIGCHFERCTAAYGGAVYAESNSTVNFQNALFRNTSAHQYHGGAIWASKFVDVQCQQCSFLNTYTTQSGAALYVTQNSTLWWSGGECRGTAARIWAGCAMFNGGSKALVEDVNVTDVSADCGGVFFAQETVMEVRNMVVANAIVTTQGGCFYCYTGCSIVVRNSTFDRCQAAALGGFSWTQTQAQIEVHNTVVTNTAAGARGAAFYIYDRSIALVYNSSIQGGVSDLGGTVSIEGPNSTFLCKDSVLKDGQANHDGGCVFVGQMYSANLTLQNCVVANCSAQRDGGALWAGAKSNVRITDNSVLSNSIAGSGGGMYIILSGVVTIGWGTVITNNTATVCGGGIGLDASFSQLILQTSAISILNNTAPKGDFGCVQSSNDTVTSSSLQYTSKEPVPASMLSGDLWVELASVGLNMISQGLPRMLPGAFFSGKPCSLALIDNSNINHTITISIPQQLPDFCVLAKDVFGNISPVDQANPVVVQLRTVGDRNLTLGGETGKAILDQITKHVCFKDLTVSGAPDQYQIDVAAVSGTISGRPNQYWPRLTIDVSSCDENHRFLVSSTSTAGSQCYPVRRTSALLRMIFGITAACLILLCFCVSVFLFRHRRIKIVKCNSFMFLSLASLGSCLCLGALVANIDGKDPASSCIVAPWLDHIGFTTVFAAIILKTFRIYRIFESNNNLDRQLGKKLRDARLLRYFAFALVLMLCFLTVWTVVKPAYPDQTAFVYGFVAVDRCQQSEFAYIVAVVRLLVQIVAVWLAFSIRNVHADFNESRFILFSTYNWAIFGGVIDLIASTFIADPEIAFIFHGISICIPNLVTVGLLGGVKAAICVFDEKTANGENNEASHRMDWFGTMRRPSKKNNVMPFDAPPAAAEN